METGPQSLPGLGGLGKSQPPPLQNEGVMALASQVVGRFQGDEVCYVAAGPMHTAGAPFLPTPHLGLKSPSQSFPEYSSNPSFFLSVSHLLNVQHTQ